MSEHRPKRAPEHPDRPRRWFVDLPVLLDTRVTIDRSRTVLVGGAPSRVLRLRTPLPVPDADGRLQLSPGLTSRLLELGMVHPVADELPAHSAPIHVVVPVRDDPVRLDRLLTWLRRGSDADALPITIVDDDSRNPDTVAEVAVRHQAQVLRPSQNLGPAGARNLGWPTAEADIIAFIDADVTVEAADLFALARHFADPGLAMVAPRVLSPESAGAVGRYEARRGALDMGRASSLVQPWSPLSHVPTACVLVRREALAEVGGFDTAMPVAEDVDLVWRLVQAKWRVRLDPTRVAGHDARERLDRWARRRHFYGTGAALLAERHGGLVAPAILTPWQLGLLGLLAVPNRWSWAGAGLLAAVMTVRLAKQMGPGQRVLGARLGLRSVTIALGQGQALVLKHWSPAFYLLALRWPNARRLLVWALIAQVVQELQRVDEFSGRAPKGAPSPAAAEPAEPGWAGAVAFGLDRLADLAYATGVWRGAVRSGSIRALLPHIVRRRRSGE